MSKSSQLRQKAQNFLKKGKLDQAIEEYKKLLSVESRNPNLYNELGDIFLRTQDRVQAVSAFEKATLNYEKVALYNNAIAVCKKILRVIPNRLDTIFKLGELKAKQNFLGEAESYYSLYFETILADPGVGMQGIGERAETVLEQLPEADELWSKAADVFSQIGSKARAAEILARLIARTAFSGDPKRVNFFRSRLDLLRPSLKEDMITKIDNIISAGEAEDGGRGVKTQSPVRPAKLESPVKESQGVESPAGLSKGSSLAGETGAERKAAPDKKSDLPPDGETVSGPEAKVKSVADASGEEAPDREGKAYVIDESPQRSVPPESSPEQSSAAGAAASSAPAPAAAGANSSPAPGETEEGSPVVPLSEDLSDIIEEEDAANEEEGGMRLAEEITSDVEEDDYKSHYDLGMAYIEMALYNDAVKELQISARSDQLQLKSLEMIGHSFLVMGNARLAVKQLERGLDIARKAGKDRLGLHYNLGLAYESLGSSEKAREHFEEVYIIDVTFRDIAEKMKKFTAVS
ncbi:MAG: tetratricopeptide repeat protein [Candidatus Krumholzibacteriota bacterium]|nr:tetratricopeptide repeat protein [Candidatus Krumholzibacteriota bacterium]